MNLPLGVMLSRREHTGQTQANAGRENMPPANQDSCWVPNQNGVQFWTLFVERVGYNTGQDFLRVYLQRKSASGPNGNG